MDPVPTTPPNSPGPTPIAPAQNEPIANARENKKSMYLIGGIILTLLTCLLLSFLLISRLVSI